MADACAVAGGENVSLLGLCGVTAACVAAFAWRVGHLLGGWATAQAGRWLAGWQSM